MNLAKAIAQDRGSQVVKMAKIYAADLNKKDIASTVARVAGGTLIIEERPAIWMTIPSNS